MTETTRRAAGWPRTGVNQTAATPHVTETGTAASVRADDTPRENRETKWTARDGFNAQGTPGRTASGSIHANRD
ncbi:MAG: hypothetical protein V4510_13000 [bacterium]